MNKKNINDSSAEQVVEIDLAKLFRACISNWVSILMVMILCAGVAFAGTKFFIAPKYESTVKIYAYVEQNMERTINESDLRTSSQLVNLYEALLKTDDTLKLIRNMADVDYTNKELSEMITTEAVNDTQVFSVTVTTKDPEESQRIARTVGVVLPRVINDLVDGAKASVVSHARLPKHQSSPNNMKNALIGAILGLLFMLAKITIKTLRDKDVHDERDIAEITDLPILAYLPDANSSGKKRYGHNYYYYEQGHQNAKKAQKAKSRRR